MALPRGLHRLALRWRGAAVAVCALHGVGRSEEDYYSTLGVPRNATTEAIRKAYKKRAALAHPDKGGDEEEFKRLSRAYTTLCDEDKRRAYDAGGPGPGPGGGGHPGAAQGGQFEDFANFARMFEDVFSGGGFESSRRSGGRRRHRVPPREVELELTLEELFQGAERRLRVERVRGCGTCGGRGGQVDTCARCGGRGVTFTDRHIGSNMIQRSQHRCQDCGGAGERMTRPCVDCKGRGQVLEFENLLVKVRPGAEAGERHEFHGAGDDAFAADGRQTFIAGRQDVVIIVAEKKHAHFERLGADLLIVRHLSLLDALTGFSISAPRVDDAKANITLRNADDAALPVAPSDVWKVRGQGMPTGQGRGDLYVRFVVDFPKLGRGAKATAEHRAALAKLLGVEATPVHGPPAAGRKAPSFMRSLFGDADGADADPLLKEARPASTADVDSLGRRNRRKKE
ncbi:hypothetical protein M885DRAFT_522580 [Pelagophyceae sp. CCMP2097]|nr:hypothetical protein M885DRAFT_522580 [Pelagophyceae sp. CCMP2097]